MKRILITGAAGFIGFHLSHRLINEGYKVTGIDALFDLDDLWIKKLRLKNMSRLNNFDFIGKRISASILSKLKNDFDLIIHLAAVSGIERFEKNREWSEKITIDAAVSVAEFAASNKIPVFYASSSSVYGNIPDRKFSEKTNQLKPVSSYSKTKLGIEDIFKKQPIPSIAMRFFTVYGEYGRPDMAYFRFAERISRNQTVFLFGRGLKRDFTYINDLAKSVILLIRNRNEVFRRFGKKIVINIGTGKAVRIEKIVNLIGKYLRVKPSVKYKRSRNFDLRYTCSDNSLLHKITGYVPGTEVEEGIERFVNWYKNILPYELDPSSRLRAEKYLEYVHGSERC
ncbi:MAG: NAD-dependent epimerase/dehydratase family protein [Deltaproteobacteria bacterium]|nr:NAD-dependent epimerase/dehydratase family protein [Deltaproteobacteria bacterium]